MQALTCLFLSVDAACICCESCTLEDSTKSVERGRERGGGRRDRDREREVGRGIDCRTKIAEPWNEHSSRLGENEGP